MSQQLTCFMRTYAHSDWTSLVEFENNVEFMFEIFWSILANNEDLNKNCISTRIKDSGVLFDYIYHCVH
jgi:hypothetical protein